MAILIDVPVGAGLFVYELKIRTAHPILTVTFKNVLRTFEAKILKIFKEFSLSPKILILKRSCMYKKGVYIGN